jgi:hypothetical protein
MAAVAPLEKRKKRNNERKVGSAVMKIIKKMTMKIAQVVEVAAGAAEVATTANILCLHFEMQMRRRLKLPMSF